MDVGISVDQCGPQTDPNEIMVAVIRDARDHILEADREIVSVVRALGGTGSQYRRERNKAIRAVVSEIYPSPESCSGGQVAPRAQAHLRICT